MDLKHFIRVVSNWCGLTENIAAVRSDIPKRAAA